MENRMKTGKQALWQWMLLAAAVVVLGACPMEPRQRGSSSPVVRFTAETAAAARARTVLAAGGAAQWSAGDAIGVYMISAGGSLLNSADRLRENVKYIAGSGGSSSSFTPASGEEPIRYPDEGSVTFIAYYPYQAVGADYLAAVAVGSQADPRTDVLYSGNAVNKDKLSGAVNLQFDHGLAKLTLNMLNGPQLAGLGGAGYTGAVIAGMPGTGKLNLGDGSVQDLGGAANISAVKRAAPESGYAATFEAVILPQAGGTGRRVTFTVAGIDHTWNIGDGVSFARGMNHRYEITVNKNDLTVSSELGGGVWSTGDNPEAAGTLEPPLSISGGYTGTLTVTMVDGTVYATTVADLNNPALFPTGTIKSVTPGAYTEILIGRSTGGGTAIALNIQANGTLAFRAPEGGFIPIGSYAEFQMINTSSASRSGTYKQEADLDLLGAVGEDWTPVGGSGPRFTGTFDGGGHTIAGLKINAPGANYQGLFGYSEGTIRNVHIASGTVQGGASTGAVCGYNDGGTIANCSNAARVEGSGVTTGGVAGTTNNSGTITDCYNTGAVSAAGSYAGGVLGSGNGSITGCYNTGTITCNGSNVGGVVGNISSAAGNLTGCYNTGSVSGANYVGGVKGDGVGDLTGCYNTGSVSGTGSHIGGVVGAGPENGTISDCYNTGAVTGGATDTGGVAGRNNSGGTITNCYNTGAVVSGTTDNAGGVAGSNNGGTIRDCYNTGEVSGTANNVGGVAGVNAGTMTACYNTGVVNGGGARIGGVSGQNNIGTITACYWLSSTGGNAVYGIGDPASDTNAAKFSSTDWPGVLGGAAGWDHTDWGVGVSDGTPGNYWKTLGHWVDGNNGRDSVFPKLWFE